MENEPLEPVQSGDEASATKEKRRGNIALVSKNIRVHSKRTSVRLEPEMWDALGEIAAAEECSIHDLCGAVHDLKDSSVSFTGALRVFMMEYYRAAARSNRQVGQVQKRLKAVRK